MYLNLWQVQRWFLCFLGFFVSPEKFCFVIIFAANQLQSCEASLGLFHAGVEVWGQARIGSFFSVTSRTPASPWMTLDVKNHEKTDAIW